MHPHRAFVQATSALIAAALLCVSASAETGAGEAPRRSQHDVRDAVNAPPLARIDRDAFRFSQQPALGGRAYVMTFSGQADGPWAEIVWLDGHPRTGWRRTRRERIELTGSEYQDLATFVDEHLARGEPQLTDDEGEGVVCTDGPGYTTERLMDGVQTWMHGFCGEGHPNQTIKNELAVWALHRLGG